MTLEKLARSDSKKLFAGIKKLLDKQKYVERWIPIDTYNEKPAGYEDHKVAIIKNKGWGPLASNGQYWTAEEADIYLDISYGLKESLIVDCLIKGYVCKIITVHRNTDLYSYKVMANNEALHKALTNTIGGLNNDI